MKCPGCGQPIMMQDDPPTLGGERRFVDVETKVRHDRCPDVAALVDAARGLTRIGIVAASRLVRVSDEDADKDLAVEVRMKVDALRAALGALR